MYYIKTLASFSSVHMVVECRYGSTCIFPAYKAIKDILLLATDGLFDNVPQEYIEGLLNGVTEENLQMKLIELIRLGLTISLDDKFLSPFAIAARAEGYKKEIGGKLDDFTVLINLFH